MTKAETYRQRAEEVRTMADCMRHPGARKQFLEIAERYERMAEAQDKYEQTIASTERKDAAE